MRSTKPHAIIVRSAIPVLALLCFLCNLWMFKAYTVDDSFITFRYVRQWVNGNGLVYNVGDRVEGYSNFLWVVLLAPLEAIGLDLFLSAKVLGGVLGLSTMLLVIRHSRRYAVPGLSALLLGATGAFAAWTVSGLETALFSFLLTLASLEFGREEERGRGWLSGLYFALLTLTRPEAIVLVGVAVLHRLWAIFRAKSRIASHDWLRAAALGMVLLPYLAWRITYYGYPLPNTVYAKSMGLSARALMEGVYYLYGSFRIIGGMVLPIVPLVAVVSRLDRTAFLDYSLLSIIAYAAVTVLGGGDWMPLQRFLVHILPLLMVCVHVGLTSLLDHLTVRKDIRAWGIALVAALQVVYLLGISAEMRYVDGIASGSLVPEGRGKVAFLLDHVESGDTIAVTDAGLVSYGLPLDVRIVDMVGLNDSHIAHQPVQLPGGLFGRHDAFGKWDVAYVLAQEPRFVQVNLLSPRGSEELFTNFTGTTLLVNDSQFRQSYAPVDGAPGIYERVTTH